MKNSQGKLKEIDELINNTDKNGVLVNPTPEQYAAIYARTSSSNDSFSIQSQIDDCEAYIKNNNLILYDIYQDKESARKKKFYERKDFKRLLCDMEAGMFKNLVLIRRDRLSRRIDDFMHLKRIFRKHNIRDYYVKEGNINFENDTYITNFLENVLMSISTLEPEYISQRTKGGRQNLRDQGIFQSSNPPTGYDKAEGEKHKFKVNHEEAELIKNVFNYYKTEIISENKTLKDLYKYFESNSISKVNKNFLNRVFQRPIYGGYMIKSEDDDISDCVKWDEHNLKYVLTYEDESVETKIIKCKNFSKIIDWKTWTEVFLHFYKSENPPQEPKYCFKGLIYCADCNTSLILVNEKFTCKCSSLNFEYLIKKIFTQILEDTNPKNIKLIFNDKINKVNEDLNAQNNSLNSLRNSLRIKLNKYINTKNLNLREEIESIQNEINSITHEQIPDPDKRYELKETLLKLSPKFIATGHGPCVKL